MDQRRPPHLSFTESLIRSSFIVNTDLDRKQHQKLAHHRQTMMPCATISDHLRLAPDNVVQTSRVGVRQPRCSGIRNFNSQLHLGGLAQKSFISSTTGSIIGPHHHIITSPQERNMLAEEQIKSEPQKQDQYETIHRRKPQMKHRVLVTAAAPDPPMPQSYQRQTNKSYSKRRL